MSHLELYYIEPSQVQERTLRLQGDEFHHAVQVRRRRLGDWLSVVDGEGQWYAGPIESIGKRELVMQIQERRTNVGEPRLHLTLAVGLLKSAHTDWVIEKGTELGVSVFQPMLTQRCVAQPPHRPERWRDKTLAAMKQCGRSRCPQIEPVRSLPAVLEAFAGEALFIAHMNEDGPEESFDKKLACASRALLLIGPEGGFSDDEVMEAAKAGAKMLGLGPRRLRSETAALAAVTKIMMLAGESP